MLEGLLGSVVGKIIATVTGMAGVFGGLAAAGALPGIGASDAEINTEAVVTTPADGSSASAGASLAGLGETGLGDLESIAPVGLDQAMAIAAQAQQNASAARAAASTCINTAVAQVTALIGSAAGAADPEQAQLLVAQAAEIGATARACAAEATALAQQSVDQGAEARSLLGGLPGLAEGPTAGPGEAGFSAALLAVDDANQIAGDALAIALGIVDEVTQLVTSALGGGVPALPGIGGGLPAVPGLGGGGLPAVPGVGGGGLPAVPGVGDLDPTELGAGLIGEVLSSLTGAMGDGLPVPGGLPVPDGLPGLGG